jgi:hypothetical protein
MSSYVINPYCFGTGPVLGVSSGEFMFNGMYVNYTGTGQWLMTDGMYLNEGT